MRTTHYIPTVPSAMLAALAVTGGAAASSAPCLRSQPYLAQLSRKADTVILGFRLTRPAGNRSVTIDGRAAKVETVGPRLDAVYQAFLDNAGLRSGRLKVGRRYPVRIRVCDGSSCTTHTDRLYLHRRFQGR